MESLLQAPGVVSYVVVAAFTAVLVLMLFYHLYGNFRNNVVRPKMERRTHSDSRRRTPSIGVATGDDVPQTSIVSEVRYSKRREASAAREASSSWRVISANGDDTTPGASETHAAEESHESTDEDAQYLHSDDLGDVVIAGRDADEHSPDADERVADRSSGNDHHSPKRARPHDDVMVERRERQANDVIENHICIQLLKHGLQISLTGEQIRQFMEERQIVFADGYFHYRGDENERRMFGIFNAMMPGTFDSNFDNVLTAGLMFVIDTTAHPDDIVDVYEAMIALAVEAAKEFDAYLLDDLGSTLCQQSINNQINRLQAARLDRLSEAAVG